MIGYHIRRYMRRHPWFRKASKRCASRAGNAAKLDARLVGAVHNFSESMRLLEKAGCTQLRVWTGLDWFGLE